MKKRRMPLIFSSAALILPTILISSCSSNTDFNEKDYLNQQISKLPNSIIVSGEYSKSKYSNFVYNLETLTEVYPEILNIDRQSFEISDTYKYNNSFDTVSVNLLIKSKKDLSISATKKITISGFKKIDAATKNEINGAYTDLKNAQWLAKAAEVKKTRKASMLMASDFQTPILKIKDVNLETRYTFDDEKGTFRIDFWLKNKTGEILLPFEKDITSMKNNMSKTISGFLTTQTFKNYLNNDIFKKYLFANSLILDANSDLTTEGLTKFNNSYLPSSVHDFNSAKEIINFFFTNKSASFSKEKVLPQIFNAAINTPQEIVNSFKLDIRANDTTNSVTINFSYEINGFEYYSENRSHIEIKFPTLDQNAQKDRNLLIKSIEKAYKLFAKEDYQESGTFYFSPIKINEQNKSLYADNPKFESSINIASMTDLPKVSQIINWSDGTNNRKIVKIENDVMINGGTETKKVNFYFEIYINKISANRYSGNMKANFYLKWLKDFKETQTPATPPTKLNSILVYPSNKSVSGEDVNYSSSKVLEPITIWGFNSGGKQNLDELFTTIKTTLGTQSQYPKVEVDADTFSSVNTENFIQKWEKALKIPFASEIPNFPPNLIAKFEFETKPIFTKDATGKQIISAKLKWSLVSENNKEVSFEPSDGSNVFEAQIILI